MIELGIGYDPGELRALQERLSASIRALGDRALFEKIAVFAEEANRRAALAGLDRYDAPLRPWRERYGISDYHGRDYEQWTNATVLIPFGTRSRRIDAFTVRIERRRILGFGIGSARVFVGYTARAGLVPLAWRAQGRDVLGLSPRTRRGLSLLLYTHATRSHGLLRRVTRSLTRWVGLGR